jgi:hypothetical protein
LTKTLRIANLSAFFSYLLFLGVVAKGQTLTTTSQIIPLNLARYVASEQVHRNNPPFEWYVLDHMVLHDIGGAVSAYAFIFAKTDTVFQSPAYLQQHIREGSALLREAQEKVANAPSDTQVAGVTPDSVVEAAETLYNRSDLATVITGATSNSKLILRHFRGIPEFWVDAATLDSQTSSRLYGRVLQVSRVIMITPMDFRLAAFEGSEAADTPPPGLRTVAETTLPDGAQCIKVSSKKIESIGAVRKERQAIVQRKQRRLNTLEPDERTKYEEALRDRAAALDEEWREHRRLLEKQDSERGADR